MQQLRQKKGSLFAAIVFAITAAPTLAGDGHWPAFRGANASGIGSGSPPTKWNIDAGENVKWKAPIPGLAHSSPIAWGDRIFVTTAVNTAGEAKHQTGWMDGSGDSAADSGEWEWKVLCLGARDGKVLWEKTAHRGEPKFKRHPKSSHANCTPATDGKHLVAFFASEGLYCYDLDGNLKWKKDLGPLNAAPAGYPAAQWGVAGSPIIHHDLVIVQCDVQEGSYWVAFEIKTGEERRRVERGDDPTWCTPSVHVGKERTQLICNGYKKMAGYDLATGKELWTMNGGGDVPVPAPVVSGDLIVVTNGHGRRPVYVVRADATGDLTPKEDQISDGLAWYNRGKGSYMPTPIVVNDVLYVADDNGILTAFDVSTGKQLFRERLPGSGKSTYSASAVAADGRLYITSEDGQVDVVKAGREYELLASNQMGDTCMATPAIADGMIVFRTLHHLYGIASGATPGH